MGKNWRIGVDPDEEAELVTSGVYSKIRYDIRIVHGIAGSVNNW
jgi:protein-S-isoprenylcysteine O-methyltransferase Ste14